MQKPYVWSYNDSFINLRKTSPFFVRIVTHMGGDFLLSGVQSPPEIYALFSRFALVNLANNKKQIRAIFYKTFIIFLIGV